MTLILFLVGLVLLIAGAEALVKGASRLAILLGVSPLVIGLTVVAFGTSSPEFAVSLKASLDGQGGIAVGNVIGSNVFNVLFILGISAIIIPLTVSRQLIRLDVPLMIVVSILVVFMARDGKFSFADGLILFPALLVYVAFLIWQSRREINASASLDPSLEAPPRSPRTVLWNLLLVLVGLGMLVIGSRWLVAGAVAFSRHFGVSEEVIGLTIIAVGTSLPEVVTSIIAAIRGERDIAVANVVGSNLFNLMGVLGLTCLCSPLSIDVSAQVARLDLPVMAAVAFACLPIFFTGGVISRREGFLFLFYYVLYTTYLILTATQSPWIPELKTAVMFFILPLTFITLGIVSVQEWKHRKALSP